MAQVEVTTEEAQLLAVYRAIKEFDNPLLIDTEQVGEATEALRAVVDLQQKEKDLSDEQMKLLVNSFVAGFGAVRLPQVLQQLAYEPPAQEGTFIGGPSGGVAEQQGSDPAFVTQSGVHDNEKKS